MSLSKSSLLIKKILLNIVGLFIMSFGISLAINTNLGVSPVTSFPFSLGLVLGISTGTMSTIVFIIFIFFQLLILRRAFKLISAFQMVSSFIFGIFLDFFLNLLGYATPPTYIGQLAMLCASIIVLSFGLTLNVSSKIMPLPPEGLVLAVVKVSGKPFSRLKVYFDCSLLLMSMAITFLNFGYVVGVREGTVITAITIGRMIPLHKMWITKAFKGLLPEEDK